MRSRDTGMRSPVEGIWRRFVVLVPLVALIAICACHHIRSVAGTYSALGNLPFEAGTLDEGSVTLSEPGVVRVVSVGQNPEGLALVTFEAISDGTTTATCGTDTNQDIWMLEVRDGAVIEGGVNFSGWEDIHLGTCLFLLVLCLLFASVIVRLMRATWFDYEMVASCGALLFCLFHLVLFAIALRTDTLARFSEFSFWLVSASELFATAVAVPMSVLAILVSLSNLSLIRHEGARPVNLLGVAVSVVWFGAVALWWQLPNILISLFPSYNLIHIVSSVVTCALTFGECLLASTILCAWLASRTEPAHAVDYLIVLGCGLRPDGTPCPLLASRVDEALAFDERCVARGEAPTTFVLSGGQGPDEVMSEAQSMANYLADKGVEPNRLVLEDALTTTRENMRFSRQAIEQHANRSASELRIGFSTTNYHVFRGYVCAHATQMAVTGMGAPTRLYFWPNAFLREFAGLLVAQWKAILQLFLAFAAIYAVAGYVLILAG